MADDSSSDVTASESELSNERKFIKLLISLYRDSPQLWNVSHPQYTEKRARVISLDMMCAKLRQYRPNYTSDMLKKKINILRMNLNKKVNNMAKNPRGSDRPASLWYYEDMKFLIEQDQDAETMSTAKKLRVSALPVPIKVNITKTSSSQKPKIPKQKIPSIHLVKNRTPSNEQSMVLLPDSHASTEESEEEMVARCWARKLRRLAPYQRIFAEKIINDTLFEGALGRKPYEVRSCLYTSA